MAFQQCEWISVPCQYKFGHLPIRDWPPHLKRKDCYERLQRQINPAILYDSFH